MKPLKYLKLSVTSLSLFLVLVNIASAETVSFFTPFKTYTVGSDITLSILVSGADRSVNAVSGLISFPEDLLTVSSVFKINSIFDSWTQEPTFSNISGYVNFESALLPTSFTGNSGNILTITFKAKSIGTANINFVSGSILTSNGVNEDILLNSDVATINIVGQNYRVDAPPIGKIEATRTILKTSSNYNASYDFKNQVFFFVKSLFKTPYTFVILISIFLIWYIFYKVFYIKNKLKKEVYEAESALHKAFNVLKESEQEQIQILEKTKSITEKEKIKRQFKKDLDDAEKYVEKEIESVEKITK
jgi:hypothetical protein